MKFKLSTYYEDGIKKKPFYQRPITYYILFIIFIVLTASAHPFDMQWKIYIQHLHDQSRSKSLAALIDIIKLFGDGKILVFVAVVLGAVGHRKVAFRMLITLLLMGVMVGILKPAVHRERPNGKNDFSFPSGDTATAAAMFIPLAAEIPVLAPAVVIVPAVAFTRNWSNWHYLSDVIGGIAFGLLATAFAFKFDIRKNKYIKLLNSRRLALLSVLLALIFFLPEMFKAGGKFFDFMSVYGTALMLWFAVNYAQMFFKNRSDKCKPVSRFALYWKKIITKHKLENFTSYKLILSDIFLVIFSIIVLILAWTSGFRELGISISGLPILLIFSVIYRRWLVHKRHFIKAATVPFLTYLLFFLFILITLLPALIKFYF
ncbi:MAG: phosphatase PAP2 family protein [bacterium]|nr:phosphatase PAP2 family protein [bacterium]